MGYCTRSVYVDSEGILGIYLTCIILETFESSAQDFSCDIVAVKFMQACTDGWCCAGLEYLRRFEDIGGW